LRHVAQICLVSMLGLLSQRIVRWSC
jgi:hypothetical protein